MNNITDEDLLNAAAAVTQYRQLGYNNTAGGVGAALLTEKGNIYCGVCIDTISGMGFCAEHAAVAAMITAGESKIERIIAVKRDDTGAFGVLVPCGRCREFMHQINESNLEADVLLSKNKTVKLKELLPYPE